MHVHLASVVTGAIARGGRGVGGGMAGLHRVTRRTAGILCADPRVSQSAERSSRDRVCGAGAHGIRWGGRKGAPQPLLLGSALELTWPF